MSIDSLIFLSMDCNDTPRTYRKLNIHSHLFCEVL
jgi:hypothetical protein